MTITVEACVNNWTSKWYRADLERAAVSFLTRKDPLQYQFLGALLGDYTGKDAIRFTEHFKILCEVAHKAPFYCPFFLVKNNSQLVMIKMRLESEVRFWNFHTAAELR